MKTPILHLKHISLKVLQLLSNVAILLLAIQVLHGIYSAVRFYTSSNVIPGVFDMAKGFYNPRPGQLEALDTLADENALA